MPRLINLPGNQLLSRSCNVLNKILTIYSKFTGFWVGIHDKTWEGKFSYESDGKSIVWKNWLDGQPNNKVNKCYGDEDCVEVGSKGKWNDQCCGKQKPYVCEKDVVSCTQEEGKSLFRNKRFALNEMFEQNASKFAIFYVDIDLGIHKGKSKVARNEKRKKLHGFSYT